MGKQEIEKPKPLYRRAPSRDRGLNPRQERFVSEYLKDLDAAAAAVRAGYAASSAAVIGSRMLRDNPHVIAAIRKKKKERESRTNITADWVLKQSYDVFERNRVLNTTDLRDIYTTDGRLKPFDQWPEILRSKQAIRSIETQEMYETVKDPKTKRTKRRLTGYVRRVVFHETTQQELKALEMLGRHTNVQAFAESHPVTGEVVLRVEYVGAGPDKQLPPANMGRVITVTAEEQPKVVSNGTGEQEKK